MLRLHRKSLSNIPPLTSRHPVMFPNFFPQLPLSVHVHAWPPLYPRGQWKLKIIPSLYRVFQLFRWGFSFWTLQGRYCYSHPWRGLSTPEIFIWMKRWLHSYKLWHTLGCGPGDPWVHVASMLFPRSWKVLRSAHLHTKGLKLDKAGLLLSPLK